MQGTPKFELLCRLPVSIVRTSPDTVVRAHLEVVDRSVAPNLRVHGVFTLRRRLFSSRSAWRLSRFDERELVQKERGKNSTFETLTPMSFMEMTWPAAQVILAIPSRKTKSMSAQPLQ